ncbi:hypothetical protein, partial [Gordonia rhizosphera]|uniref:hypothetical protein n=1 Tax=Gordonia rhizosphera TaxID=83341 RepID=UPI0012F68998
MGSAFAKLARAKVHLDALRNEVHEYRGRKPLQFEALTTNHPDGSSRLIAKVVAQVKEEIPSGRSVVIGDILTNLRASLDHAIYGHVIDSHAYIDETKVAAGIKLPITANLREWRREENRLAPLVAPSVLKTIAQIQCFQPDQPSEENHALIAFNKLVNRDKHRSIRPVFIAATRIEIAYSGLEVEEFHTTPGPFSDGGVVGIAVLRLPKAKALQL